MGKKRKAPKHTGTSPAAPAKGEAPEPADLMGGLKAIAGDFGTDIVALDCKQTANLQFKIDGLTYTNTKLPATIGLELWPRLTVLFGAGLLQAMATGEAGAGFDPVRMLYGLASRAMQDGLVPVIMDLLKNMQCGALRPDGKAGAVVPAFDDHFAGEYLHLAKVVTFAVAHNLKGPTLGAR